jgi:hypothetical protein
MESAGLSVFFYEPQDLAEANQNLTEVGWPGHGTSAAFFTASVKKVASYRVTCRKAAHPVAAAATARAFPSPEPRRCARILA